MISQDDLYALALLKIAAEKKDRVGTGAAALVGAGLGAGAGSFAGTLGAHVIGRDMMRQDIDSTKRMIEGKIRDFQGLSLGKKLKFLFRAKKK